MRQCTVKPAWIGHALKRRPYWEEQTRLIPSVFYMLSFHPFLKQKNVKRTLLQTDNISSPLIKKQPAWRGHKDFRNSRETENYLGHFCQISQKEAFFLHFKRTFFFLLISICSFEGVQHFSLELAIFYNKLLSATSQQLFLRHWKRYRPSNHIAPLYELLVSVLWLTLSFDEVSKTCRRMH